MQKYPVLVFRPLRAWGWKLPAARVRLYNSSSTATATTATAADGMQQIVPIPHHRYVPLPALRVARLETFKTQYFDKNLPVVFPLLPVKPERASSSEKTGETHDAVFVGFLGAAAARKQKMETQFPELEALKKWFVRIHPGEITISSAGAGMGEVLNMDYLAQYADCMVPVEKTMIPATEQWDGWPRPPLLNGHEEEPSPSSPPLSYASVGASGLGSTATDANREAEYFERTTIPLSLFMQMTHLTQTSPPESRPPFHLYLAQACLTSLPTPLQADLPPPHLIHTVGRGDVYSSSLWLGLPPTYTPLHRDPNPNLFVQLSGAKVVRLLSPEAGRRVFRAVRKRVGGRDGAIGCEKVRGEEMMYGEERALLEKAIWEDDVARQIDEGTVEMEMEEGFEVLLRKGEGLFIPNGWWHSLKGVGRGMVGSANWWFR